MKYPVSNTPEYARLLQLIMADATEHQLNVADFHWFAVTLLEALEKSLQVELRFDADTNPDACEGQITDATLEYSSTEPNHSKLEFDFKDKKTGETRHYEYSFNAERVEENRNSKPGQFMKYYIHSDNFDTTTGFTFRYK